MVYALRWTAAGARPVIRSRL